MLERPAELSGLPYGATWFAHFLKKFPMGAKNRATAVEGIRQKKIIGAHSRTPIILDSMNPKIHKL